MASDLSREILVMIGLALGIISYIPYTRDILRGKTKPHFFTWFIWTVLTFIVFAAQISEKGGIGSYIVGLTGLTSLLITVLALYFGEKSISRSDTISFGLALLTIPLWIITKTPLYSVMLIILIDMLGFYPTCRKSWDKPYEETLSLYAISSVKFFIAVVTLENYTLVTVLYPVFWTIMNVAFAFFCLWRRNVLKVR